MAQASIPVDLFNPGQVFACLGFLEAADVLLGRVEGGFDWTNGAEARFDVHADGVGENPFAIVLEFLAKADVRACAPRGYDPPRLNKKEADKAAAVPRDEQGDASAVLLALDTFPAASGDQNALPVCLVIDSSDPTQSLDVSHWADGSSRNDFKLYSGNRSAASIARAMLQGTGEKIANTSGVAALWAEHPKEMAASPFQLLTPMRGSFNFDPRGGWTPIDAGYSPNDQNHRVEASPVVEMLAAIGLEHARPDEFEIREVRYGAWKGLLPPVLARAALGGVRVVNPIRIFRFTLELAGKNKIVTFAREETHS